MKVVKVTLGDDSTLFVLFDELDKFAAHFAAITKLEGIEMTEEDYNQIPIDNRSGIFFS